MPFCENCPSSQIFRLVVTAQSTKRNQVSSLNVISFDLMHSNYAPFTLMVCLWAASRILSWLEHYCIPFVYMCFSFKFCCPTEVFKIITCKTPPDFSSLLMPQPLWHAIDESLPPLSISVDPKSSLQLSLRIQNNMLKMIHVVTIYSCSNHPVWLQQLRWIWIAFIWLHPWEWKCSSSSVTVADIAGRHDLR